MANYLVNDTQLTSIADAIREKSGSNEGLSFPAGFVSEIGNIEAGSGGGGGSSNVVMGTFLLDDSVAGTAQTINLPYTGDGYPVALMIYPSGGENVIDSLNEKYPYVIFSAIKKKVDYQPQYTGANQYDGVRIVMLIKAGSSLQANYDGLNMYDDLKTASQSRSNMYLHSDNTMSVYALPAGNNGTSSNGFRCGIEYSYIVVYSEPSLEK